MRENSKFMSPVACRVFPRQAISLIELTVVVAILGLLSISAISRYGNNSISNGGAEGFARKLALSMVHARRSTISTGDNHFVQLTSSGGDIVSYTIIQRASGGDVQIDQSRAVPRDVVVTASASELEFDFDGAALAAYSVQVAGTDRSWTISVDLLTGYAKIEENP